MTPHNVACVNRCTVGGTMTRDEFVDLVKFSCSGDPLIAAYDAACAERDALLVEVEQLADSVRANQPNLDAYQERNRELQAEVERLREALRDLVYAPVGAGDEERLERSERWRAARRALDGK